MSSIAGALKIDLTFHLKSESLVPALDVQADIVKPQCFSIFTGANSSPA
jgi:hypothetical protein